MKCDELKPFDVIINDDYTALYYAKESVDEAIDEQKDELNRAKAREDVLVTDNRDLLDKVKMLEERLRENAEHFKRNEMQIIESSDNEIKKLKAENERLNRELEHVKNGDCINTCDVVEKHVKEELKAKRALWIARAKRAIEKIAWFRLWNASISTMNPEDGARQEYEKWKKALGKFLNKAEEYK